MTATEVHSLNIGDRVQFRIDDCVCFGWVSSIEIHPVPNTEPRIRFVEDRLCKSMRTESRVHLRIEMQSVNGPAFVEFVDNFSSIKRVV